MSIETTLTDLVTAVRELTLAITKQASAPAAQQPAAPTTQQPEPAAPSKPRTRKAAASPETAPQGAQNAEGAPTPTPDISTPSQAALDATKADGYLLPGDPPGTRYFVVAEHNTVYRQLPGMTDCTLSGAVIVSGPHYLEAKAEIEKKFPTAAAAAQSATAAQAATVVTAPTATAPAATASGSDELTFEKVIEKVRELNNAMGRDGVMALLTRYGVEKVPALQGKASNGDLIAAADEILMGL